MKNILTILSEAGVELTEEQKETVNKVVLENYKTIEDYNGVVEKRDGLQKSLDDVQGKLQEFEKIDIEDLQGQIRTLTTDLQAEKDARVADARKIELEKSVDTFLSDKKFVNDLTAKSIRGQLMEVLDQDAAKGKSIDDLFKGLITDDEGKELENILVSEAEQNKAKFTRPAGKLPGAGTKLNPSELMKLKNENPDMDISQYM